MDVRSPAEGQVPLELEQGRLSPVRQLTPGEQVMVELTVRRPSWVGWLVGHTEQLRLVIKTPEAQVLSRWVEVKSGAPVTVSFSIPVARLSVKGSRARSLSVPQTVVPVGVVASGSHGVGTIEVAAAARSWERLSAPVKVTWFPATSYPQVLVTPSPGALLSPTGQLTLTFSDTVKDALGSSLPQLSPAAPGSWRALDTHTLVFQPSGMGFPLGETVRVTLPGAIRLAGQTGPQSASTLEWHIPQGSTLRLQQLLAQLGYLPLDWQPTGDSTPPTAAAQLAAAVSPPSGGFSWRYANTPPELAALWKAGELDEITRGAVMMFENTHGLTVDGLIGPKVWAALIADVVAGNRYTGGYSYVYVHRDDPQLLTLWHNGQVILTSPGNTGVPSAPTELGTFPVFEHIPVGTMSGTNPDGSHYNDPGIRYISYFNGGDAIHSFDRASYGTPQSLGCVELPLAAAAQVWPYTPIGTLVTIEN